MEIVLHRRNLSIKEVAMDKWISASTPGSNPHKAKNPWPDDAGVAEKNKNNSPVLSQYWMLNESCTIIMSDQSSTSAAMIGKIVRGLLEGKCIK